MQQYELSRIKTFNRRALLLAGAKGLLLTGLFGRLYYLQVVESDKYRVLAEENRINLRLLPPPRGRILDRNSEIIADNRQNYRVIVVAEQAGEIETVVDRLADLILIGPEERERILREAERKSRFVPITVREHLSWNQVAKVEVNTLDLPGVSITVGLRRHYPFGASFAHVIGYVAAVSEKELTGDPLLELPDFRIGKNGVEKIHDIALRGRAGNSQIEVNAHGRTIRELARNEGEAGSDVILTIDRRLQEFSAARLGAESASAVVMDVTNGEVLTVVSTPSFDPNAFNQGLTHRQWSELVNNPRAPLINKAIAGQYPPGSTFKLAVAMAALESGFVPPEHGVRCDGYLELGNRRFHCWKRGGHGFVTMVEGLARSCDVFFYDIALKIGIQRIADMARRLGLGESQDFDLPGERSGLIPTPDWKLATYDQRWQKGETLNSGIGQGYVLATPLQLAVMTARIVNGGRAVRPHITRLVGAVTRPADVAVGAADDLGFSDAALNVVRRGMDKVVNDTIGTAFGARIEDEATAMAGKTGTSQVRRITKKERDAGIIRNEDRPWRHRDHALFVGYAPVHAPRFAVSVVVEHGGGGSKVAAPMARDILIETQKLYPPGETTASTGRPKQAG